MINKRIIKKFEQLVTMIEQRIDDKSNVGDNNSDFFRVKQLKNVLNILKKYPIKITKDNLDELKKIKGIGAGTIQRIEEILNTKKLEELKDFVDTTKEKTKALEDLESVVGIGHIIALEYYNQNIKSVKELKKAIKEGKIEVNEKILLGLKYYKKFEGNIPHEVIKKINKIFEFIFKDKNYMFEIAGSYRREKLVSGDIDVIVTKKKNLDKENDLQNIISILKKPIAKNNNQPLIVDDITEFGKTKYMGFIKYLDYPIWRLDVRLIPIESYYTALVYFTGSAEFNKKMRIIAKSKNYKLSEYGLFKENGEHITINSERELFDILGMEYLHPRLR